MRTTEVRLVHHLGLQFKVHWLLKRKRKLFVTPAEAVLLAKGAEIVEAKQVLRPALIEEPYEPPYDDLKQEREEKTPCYIINKGFRAVGGIEQCQLLTNSLVFDSFPKSILDKVQDPTPEDQKAVTNAILHSQILDAHQDRLPHNLDIHNQPGYNPPRRFGIRNYRKIGRLVHDLLLHLSQTDSHTELKPVLSNVKSSITLNHSDKLMHMNHDAAFIVCGNPLDAVASREEVRSMAGSEMPDLYPLSPLIHARVYNKYNFKNGFAISGGSVAPRTVFVSYENLRLVLNMHEFYGMTLINAFSHAASYAKQVNKELTGDLDKPVTINIVHTNGQHMHVGRFQLNTLDCTGSTRNLFWHEPSLPLFERAKFENAKPVIDNVNVRPLSLLKALY